MLIFNELSSGLLEQMKGWWQVIHDKVVLWIASLNLTGMKLIELFSFAAAGFFIGFLLRKHLRLIFVFLLLTVALIWIFQEFNLLNINWDQLKQLGGMISNESFSTVVNTWLDWIKANMLSVIGFLLGFLIGYRA